MSVIYTTIFIDICINGELLLTALGYNVAQYFGQVWCTLLDEIVIIIWSNVAWHWGQSHFACCINYKEWWQSVNSSMSKRHVGMPAKCM